MTDTLAALTADTELYADAPREGHEMYLINATRHLGSLVDEALGLQEVCYGPEATAERMRALIEEGQDARITAALNLLADCYEALGY